MTRDNSIELWDAEKILQDSSPLILTPETLKKERIREERLVFQAGRYAQIYQNKDHQENDAYRMLCKFRNVAGCWFLEEVDDSSE